MSEETQVRFVTIADVHWNQSSDFESNALDALDLIHDLHDDDPIDFVAVVGDIVDDDEDAHHDVREEFFDELPSGVDWYPVAGNHDWATDSEWEDAYDKPKQQTFEYGDYGFICTDTSEPRTAEFQEADADFIENGIDEFSDKDGVIIFNHTAQYGDEAEIWGDRTDDHAVDAPEVVEQFEREEVLAVYQGHNHDINQMVEYNGTKYIYCCLVGGFRSVDDDWSEVDYGLRVTDLY